MLTEEQLEQRTRSIGASEVAAIAGVDPFRTPLDVWASKRRGAALELEPVAPPADAQPMDPADPRDVGHLLEDPIAQLYSVRTGFAGVERSPTMAHPERPHHTATPDRIVLTGSRRHGLECKAVGHRMAHHWPDEGGVPAYVALQCAWGMHVTGLDRWDVAALIGTDFRVATLDRDDELIEGLVELVEAFWRDHVLGDRMPEARDGRDAQRVLGQRWPRDDGEYMRRDGADIERTVLALVAAQERERAAKAEADKIKAALCALTGEAAGLEGPWGRFSWRSMRGGVAWKQVAEHLAGGTVPEAVLERFRGADYRKPMIYPHKGWLARARANAPSTETQEGDTET